MNAAVMSAMSFAELLGARVEAVHVKEDGDHMAHPPQPSARRTRRSEPEEETCL
jgi:hypothetical protein